MGVINILVYIIRIIMLVIKIIINVKNTNNRYPNNHYTNNINKLPITTTATISQSTVNHII